MVEHQSEWLKRRQWHLHLVEPPGATLERPVSPNFPSVLSPARKKTISDTVERCIFSFPRLLKLEISRLWTSMIPQESSRFLSFQCPLSHRGWDWMGWDGCGPELAGHAPHLDNCIFNRASSGLPSPCSVSYQQADAVLSLFPSLLAFCLLCFFYPANSIV